MLKYLALFGLLLHLQSSAQKFLPPRGKQLLILGQDLDAVKGYVNSGLFPTPGGHTVYLNLYYLNDAAGNYGGLGEDISGNVAADADWGAGKVNAHKAAFDTAYRNTTLIIGLYMEDAKRFKEVQEGEFDANIKRLGEFIKKVNKPVFLRIAYEFEGNWNPSYANAAVYKAAFRRVTEVLKQQGVHNFATVWQTSASPLDDIMEKKHENIEDWYPGDDVVDWMGLSWFLPPGYQSTVSAIKTTQGLLAEELLQLARKHNKPVMIAESSPQGYDLQNLTKRNIAQILDGPPGRDTVKLAPQQVWNNWYKPFFAFIKKNSDVVSAVAYINANWDSQTMWGAPYQGGYWGNAQVQLNPYIAAAWKNEITKSNWLHGSNKLFDQLKAGGNDNRTSLQAAAAISKTDNVHVLLNKKGYPYVFELNAGESDSFKLNGNGSNITRRIKVISITPYYEPNFWFSAPDSKNYSKAEVVVEVSGKRITLVHRPYQMPVTFNGVRLFVETIREWAVNAEIADMKDVVKDVRLSVCAAGESWGPTSFVFPLLDYRWKSAVYQNTWSALVPFNLRYYHRGEDYGAIPDKVNVLSPFKGTITLSPLPSGDSKSNSINVQNEDGINCRLAHMNTETINKEYPVGTKVEAATVLAKTGMTWNGQKSQTHDPHCHIELQYADTKLASYPYLMEAYLRTYPDEAIAVAGGYHFSTVGRDVLLDGGRSLTKNGETIKSYQWTLHDGKVYNTAQVKGRYEKPGLYAEELKINTSSGATDRDFVQVRVYDSTKGKDVAFGWAYYYPLRNIKPNTPVLFWNRLINTKSAVSIDFGDGEKQKIEKETTHSYRSPGRYIVTLSSTGPGNEPVTVKMEVVVEG